MELHMKAVSWCQAKPTGRDITSKSKWHAGQSEGGKMPKWLITGDGSAAAKTTVQHGGWGLRGCHMWTDNKMSSVASRPQSNRRVGGHLSGHILKVLLERSKLALLWLCSGDKDQTSHTKDVKTTQNTKMCSSVPHSAVGPQLIHQREPVTHQTVNLWNPFQ